MNCPKCGAAINHQYTALDVWMCGTSQVHDMAINESTLCLRNQLATITAERDAARVELKEQLVVRYTACDPELYLEPHNDRDRDLLEQIEKNCITKGMGRHCDTGKLLHVRIALQPVIRVFPESINTL